MATKAEVEEFLVSFRVAIEFQRVAWKSREKTERGLETLGITKYQALELISLLTCEDYHAGPKPDDTDSSKTVWEFGCRVGGIMTYVKLRIDDSKHGLHRGIVWACHPAEFPMVFPLARPLKGGRP